MKPCPEWEEERLTLVTGEASAAMHQHLAHCEACANAVAELRSRQTRIEAALRQILNDAGPRPGFLEDVLQRAPGARLRRRYWAWALAAAASLALWIVWPYAEPDVDSPSVLAWQSPTAALLRSPAEALLRSTPRLGESYGNLDLALGEREEGVVR